MVGSDTKRHPAPRPPSPPRPSHPGPLPPRPFPHPPGPASPLVPLGPSGLAGAASAAGRRFPLLGGAIAGAAFLWWLWSALNPPAPLPPFSPRVGGVYRVFGRWQTCDEFHPVYGNCVRPGSGFVEYEIANSRGLLDVRGIYGTSGFEIVKWARFGNVWLEVDTQFYIKPPEGYLIAVGSRVTFAPDPVDGQPPVPAEEMPSLGWPRSPGYPLDPFGERVAGPAPKPFPPPSPAPAPGAPGPERGPKAPPRQPAPRHPAPRTPEPAPAPAPRPPAPALAPAPAPAPAPRPAPPPAPRPQRAPRPAPAPAPAPAPLQWPAEWPQQSPRPAPLRPAPLPLPAPGPVVTTDGAARPELKPAPGPVRPSPDVHIVDGVEFGGGGQSPPPTLVAVAAELGRIETKLAWLISRSGNGVGGGCQFLDRTDEVLEVIESLQFDVDELAGRPERELGPLAVTSEAPADFNDDGARASFEIDIPRLPATQFETLFLQRLLEFLHWQKSCRNHVAKRGTDGDPVTITWRQVPFS